MERMTGKTPQRLLDAPLLPDGLGQLWADFIHLHSRRGSTGMGPARITDEQIISWQRLHHVALPGWQIDAIYRSDDAFFASQQKKG